LVVLVSVGVDFKDAFMSGAEVEFVDGGEHAVALDAAEFFGADNEWFFVAEGGRDGGAGRNPDGEQAFFDVGRAANYGDEAFGIAGNEGVWGVLFHDAGVVDIA